MSITADQEDTRRYLEQVVRALVPGPVWTEYAAGPDKDGMIVWKIFFGHRREQFVAIHANGKPAWDEEQALGDAPPS